MGWSLIFSDPLPGVRQLYLSPLARDGTHLKISFSTLGIESIVVGPTSDTIPHWEDHKYCSAYLYDPIDEYMHYGDVKAYYNDEFIADGRAVESVRNPFGSVVGLTASGYFSYISDRSIVHTSGVKQTRENIIRDFISTYCPYIAIYDPLPMIGGTIAPIEYYGLKPDQLLERIRKEGDQESNELFTYMLPGRILKIFPNVEPVIPDYDFPVVPNWLLSFKESADWVVTHASISYKDFDSGQDTRYPLNKDFQANQFLKTTWPYIREIQIKAGIMTQGAAQFALNSYLNRHSKPSIDISLSLPIDEFIDGTPAYQILPTKYLSWGTKGPIPIQNTTIDTASNKVTIKAGTLERGLDPFNRLFADNQRRTNRINVAVGGSER